MDTTLSEQLLLLALDTGTGRFRQRTQTEYAASTAVLLELALAGRVQLEGDRVVLRDGTPLGTPGLDEALELLGGQGKENDLHKALHDLRQGSFTGALRGLTDKGVLREKPKGAFGSLRSSRYELVDSDAVASPRKRMSSVVLEDENPDERTACLVLVVHHAGLWGTVLPRAGKKAVEKRVEEITERHWAQPALQGVADAVLASLVASTTTSVAATAATGS